MGPLRLLSDGNPEALWVGALSSCRTLLLGRTRRAFRVPLLPAGTPGPCPPETKIMAGGGPRGGAFSKVLESYPTLKVKKKRGGKKVKIKYIKMEENWEIK